MYLRCKAIFFLILSIVLTSCSPNLNADVLQSETTLISETILEITEETTTSPKITEETTPPPETTEETTSSPETDMTSEEDIISGKKKTYSNIPELDSAIKHVFGANSLSQDNKDSKTIEEIAKELLDRNMICAYTYCTEALFTQKSRIEDENGYFPIEFYLFNNYSEFESFITGTYAIEYSDTILNNFIKKGPTFIQKNEEIYYNPNKTGFTTGPYYDKGYSIEITNLKDDECTFICSPNFDEKDYNDLMEWWRGQAKNISPQYIDTYMDDVEQWAAEDKSQQCKMLLQNGEWRLESMVYAF